MNLNLKKKGQYLKGGLKYFSQMFEEENQSKEIQIGLPTDVKHVAHIGWDGPSTNAPSWMNEFKSQSAPLDVTGSDALNRGDTISNDAMGNASNSSARDMPGLPKSSRVRHPSMDSVASLDESPPGSPNSSSRSIKSKDKDPSKSSGSSRRGRKEKSKNKEATSGDENGPAQNLPNIPKKSSRRKKSKDVSEGGSVRSSVKSSKRGSRGGSEDGSTRLQRGGSSTSTLEEEP